MAGAIRFTAAERAWIAEQVGKAAGNKTAELVLAKLERSELPVRRAGLAPQKAIEAFGEVLGRRLIVPPSGAIGVYRQMAQRLASLGMTRGDCVTVAKVAAAEWTGHVRAESLVRQADKLMAASQQTIDYEGATGSMGISPQDLQDDDL